MKHILFNIKIWQRHRIQSDLVQLKSYFHLHKSSKIANFNPISSLSLLSANPYLLIPKAEEKEAQHKGYLQRAQETHIKEIKIKINFSFFLCSPLLASFSLLCVIFKCSFLFRQKMAFPSLLLFSHRRWKFKLRFSFHPGRKERQRARMAKYSWH